MRQSWKDENRLVFRLLKTKQEACFMGRPASFQSK
jgi:hypothetical protein